VRTVDQAVSAIKKLNQELPGCPGLAARLGQAHAYYVLNEDDNQPIFGFSKFVGYQNLTGESYLREYKKLTGINTEHALAEWFEEVRYGSPQYRILLDKLSDWMASYGKRPRQGASQKLRLMVLKPEFRAEAEPSSDDRDLLNLLIAVAGQLPLQQRLELRAAL
jgi:hypothetical protein